MSINIQTKFNIGDKVWIPNHCHNWFPIREAYTVFNIEVSIDAQSQRVFYIIKNDNGNTERYPSRLCFKSYDECKQWCDKDNNK